MDHPKNSRRARFLNALRQINKYVINRIILLFSAGKRGPFSILTHTGHRTGKTYRTPVLSTYVEDKIWIPLWDGRNVDWLNNVIAKNQCALAFTSQSFPALEPRLIPVKQALTSIPEDRRRLFQRFKLEMFLCLNRSTTSP